MSIHISEKAAERIRKGLEHEKTPDGGLRLGVRGGGCSGLNYVMKFEAEKRPGDKIFEEYGAKVFVDLKSYLYLKGVTLDWQGALMQEGFTFVNPNAAKTCSCGLSFTI